MSLKNKIITLLLCLFGVYAIIEYAIQRFVLLPAFVQLDMTAATDNTERVIQALERDVELLIPSAKDWATWDDTYEFIDNKNSDYIEANLNVKALESLGVNLLVFYDIDGRRVWGKGYDFDSGEEVAMGELSEDSLNPAHPLLGTSSKEDTVSGLYRTPTGAILVASRPILTSNGDGPSRGRVVIGRFLNEAAIERLELQARVNLKTEHLAGSKNISLNQRKSSKNSNKISHSPIELTEEDMITRGNFDIMDVAGVPILRFQVYTPRSIVAQGRTTLQFAAMSLAIAGALVLLVLLIFLRRTVFAPIALLTQHAKTIGSHEDLNERLQIQRKDEIGTLANEFNLMVERLAETRKQLIDQSYQSGVAEMASGALHNIGNAITPIGVKLINLRQELKQAPVAELAMASAELADPSTPADRIADLNKFFELAGEELAALVTKAAEELDKIRSQVDLVQMILADQQRFSRAERTIEPLNLFRFINETAELLPEQLHNIMRIEIDKGVAEIGRVYVTRIALQQVVTNVFINAAESIHESGQTEVTGRIRVYAVTAEADPQGLAHICFEDNGRGISPEHLPHLFERNFSTKNRGTGIGLHWCANTISVMGGRLYTQVSESGQGACFHLLLPLTEQSKTTTEKAI